MGVLPKGLYRSGDSWLHRLHPITKLVFSFAAIIVIFSHQLHRVSPVIPGLLAWMLLVSAGMGVRASVALFRLLAAFTIILLLLHGFFNPANQIVLLTIGPFSIGKEGLVFAEIIIIRLISALASSFVFVFSTKPDHLIQALTELGMSNKLAYLLGSPLLLLPRLSERVKSIQSAQQSRGLKTQGSLFTRMRALVPLISPLIFSSLIDAEERSTALEVRGFTSPNKKTHLYKLADTRFQYFLRIGMMIMVVLLVLIGKVWM